MQAIVKVIVSWIAFKVSILVRISNGREKGLEKIVRIINFAEFSFFAEHSNGNSDFMKELQS